MALFNTKDRGLLNELNEAWLRKYTKQNPLYNPLDILTSDSDIEFEKKLTWLLTNTEYISFISKHIFNVELLPFQDVILNELWNRKYPMFVGTRGAGKTFILALYALLRAALIPGRKVIVAGASFRQSKFLHEYMETIWRNAPIFRDLCDQDSGPFKAPDVCRFRINDSLIQSLPIGDGCVSPLTATTYADRFGVIGDTQLNSTAVWGNNKFRKIDYFIDNGIKSTKIVTTNNGYSFEATHNHAMRDIDGEWLRTDKMKIGDKLLIDNSIRWHNGDSILSIIECYQIGYSCKPLDNEILKSNKDKMSECIRGIFDACGRIEDQIILDIKDKILLQQVQYILLHYGIISKIQDGLILYENSNGSLSKLLNYATNEKYEINDNNFDSIFSIEDSECHTYDIHVPDGNEYCANGFFSHNSKIRGYRAHDLIVDEFACLRSSTIIQTDRGLIKLSDYLSGDAYRLMNLNGELETPDKIFKTPKTDVYRIETDNGYHFECSNIHQVMTTNGWKLAKDLTSSDYLPLDINKYFPEDHIKKNNVVLDERLAWLIGILISEGTLTNRNFIQVTNTDKNLIDTILSKFSDLNWEITEKEPYIDKRGFNCKRSWSIKYSNTEFRTMLRDFGVSYDISLNKTIPSGILTSPKEVVVAFLSGLIEGDGTVFYYGDKGKRRIGVAYYTSSEELADTLQILLLKFNITCSKTIRNKSRLSKKKNYMLCMRGNNAFKIYNLLNVIKWKDKFDSAVFYHRKPTISTVTEKTTRYNLSTSIGNKNKHLGSFSSREEAVDFFDKYLESEKPVFRVKSVEKLPEQEHLYDFHMPQTHSFIGNGFTQHNSHNPQIFETVLTGFGNVSANTIESVKIKAAQEIIEAKGLDINDIVEFNPLSRTNQIIISGTAYYDFHFFADYWRKWKMIIESCGNEDKISEIFNGDIPKGFDWRQYSVIRLPYELVPKGFMDEANIARSKASVHSGIFEMEYGACVGPSTKIITKNGIKPITDVSVGDYVLTHLGRWRRVTGKTNRFYFGEMLKISRHGMFSDELVTPDHLFYDGETFKEILDCENLVIPNLRELDNRDKITIDNQELKLDYKLGNHLSSLDRAVNADILYSNFDLLEGFVLGLVDDDGKIKRSIATPNLDLLIQINISLSLFGIACCITKKSDELYDLYIPDPNNSYVNNNGRNSIYKIKQIEKIPYSGLVYNLHVEEDESYCTLGSCSHNCFTKDSKGFFKRSLIESCVTSELKRIGQEGNIVFDAMTSGNPNLTYVMAIDPASEVDNFAIVILEVHPTHRRVVHCWTINRSAHIERLKSGLIQEDNYYSYCARKIRSLMSSFNVTKIMLDSQGGGIAVSEALHDSSSLKQGEVPIWPTITDKPKPSDDEQGLHIIEFVSFSSQEWTSEANHGLRKDMEDKVLLFPKFDPIILALSVEDDKESNRIYDTLEDCVTEIEELKNELVLIELTTTQSGRERWDTPEIKVSNRKGRMRKDRYSALLMANMGARSNNQPRQNTVESYGGFSRRYVSKEKTDVDYIAPSWFTEGMKDTFGAY